MESLNISTSVTPRAIRASILSAHASYSASLFVTLNASFLVIDTTSPFGVRSMTLIPALNWFTAPSKYIRHPYTSIAILRSSRKSSWASFESGIELRAKNSATALPFIIFFVKYCTSNSVSRMSHLASFLLGKVLHRDVSWDPSWTQLESYRIESIIRVSSLPTPLLGIFARPDCTSLR